MLNLKPGAPCTVVSPTRKVRAVITHVAGGYAYTSTGHRVSVETGLTDRSYGDHK